MKQQEKTQHKLWTQNVAKFSIYSNNAHALDSPLQEQFQSYMKQPKAKEELLYVLGSKRRKNTAAISAKLVREASGRCNLQEDNGWQPRYQKLDSKVYDGLIQQLI